MSGREDIKEKVYGDLRKKKKDLRDILEKQQLRGQHCVADTNMLNDLKIPNKKKDKKCFRGTYNFKLPE